MTVLPPRAVTAWARRRWRGMATEHNVALVRHAVEAIWNRGELEAADAVFAPDYVNHGGLITDLVRGPEAIKVSVALYRRAFPAPPDYRG